MGRRSNSYGSYPKNKRKARQKGFLQKARAVLRHRASTSSTAQVISGELFVEVPPTTVSEAGEAAGPDASKQQLPSHEEEVIEKPKPLPKLRHPRRPPLPATMSTRTTLRVTEADKQQLARLVQAHPVLYDTSCEHFRDKAQTRRAWQDISRNMLRTESECTSIWKILRERYKGGVRRRKLKMDQGLVGLEPSKYEDFMFFMKPFLMKRGAAAAKPLPSPSPPPLPSPSPSPPPPPDQLACESPAAALTYPAQPQRNYFIEFFRNLGGTVKDFPIDVRNRVKNEVLKVVSDAREFVLSNATVEQLFVVEDIKEEPLE